MAERRRRAERAMAKRQKSGHPVAPVRIAGRSIATTFWGQAWCDSMESYHDYENRLPRGRTYVRNGSVVDLQIAPGRIAATVSGSELYDVTITIKETPAAQWRSICADCAGGIDSLVELLQGRLSKGVMERLCRQQGGLFPRPAEIRFACTCPDHASMCKHIAAVLYGVGARLDEQPELLFELRAVDATDLVARIDAALPLSKQGPADARLLEDGDVAALFGIDMVAAPDAPATSRQSRRTAPTAATKKAAARTKPLRPQAGKPEAPPAVPARTRSPGPRQVAAAKAESRPVARTKPVADPAGINGKTNGTRQNTADRTASSAAPGRTRRAKPAAGAPPARGRATTPAAKPKAAPTPAPRQKPVKWW
jgi:uncharacterized Zn finger protein